MGWSINELYDCNKSPTRELLASQENTLKHALKIFEDTKILQDKDQLAKASELARLVGVYYDDIAHEYEEAEYLLQQSLAIKKPIFGEK
ncbi:MAG: hypothetical protein MRQ09_06600 [Candidatus Midichloria sp.]|nr:hypothetical protein [Candidatus Midichloria sp.]